MKKFDKFCIGLVMFSFMFFATGVIAGACTKTDEPIKQSSTYGFMNHEGITMEKWGIIDILYDPSNEVFYVEYDDVDAFDYENFYFSKGTTYLDYIKVIIDKSDFDVFVSDYKNLSADDFMDKYDMFEVSGYESMNIFYKVHCNE